MRTPLIDETIRNNYPYYIQMLNGIKHIDAQSEQTENDNRYVHLYFRLVHEASIEGLNLEVEKNLVKRKYTIKMAKPDFTASRLCRMDSDGPTHYNNTSTSSIEDGSVAVRTPHFHKFNEDGIEIAFRTPEIEEKQDNIKQFVQTGLQIFCREFHIQDCDHIQLNIGLLDIDDMGEPVHEDYLHGIF